MNTTPGSSSNTQTQENPTMEIMKNAGVGGKPNCVEDLNDVKCNIKTMINQLVPKIENVVMAHAKNGKRKVTLYDDCIVNMTKKMYEKCKSQNKQVCAEYKFAFETILKNIRDSIVRLSDNNLGVIFEVCHDQYTGGIIISW